MRDLFRVAGCGAGLSLFALATALNAQDAPAVLASPAPSHPSAPSQVGLSPSQSGLEEIVVTAQKRSENLQTVPIAVTAIGGAALESRAATSLQSLQATVPNVQINNFSNTPQTAVFAIRGIGVI